MGAKRKHDTSNSSPANVLDLNVVQGWKRHKWRLAQHSNNTTCVGVHPRATRILFVFLLTLNIIFLVSLLSLSILHTTATNPTSTEAKIPINVTVVTEQMSQLKLPPDNYRREIAAIYQKDGNLMKPAAHCVIDPGFLFKDDLAVLRWQCDGNMTFHKNVLQRNDSLSIRVGGYYFAYSQIIYHGEGTEELDYGRIIHSLLKQKESELNESPTILMQNLQSTPTIRRGRQAYTTSSLGATFYLEANSRISVKSSIPRNIDKYMSPYSTYFGLFLI